MNTIFGVWAFVISAVTLTALFLIVLRFRTTSVGRAFLFLLICAWIWTVGYIFELYAKSLATKLVFAQIQYIGITSIPIAWLRLASIHTGRRLPKGVWLASAVIALATLIQVFFISRPNLFWAYPSLVSVTPNLLTVNYDYGPWFYYILTPYIFILVLASLGMLIHMLVQPHMVYKRQTLLIIGGTLIPLVLNILYVLDITPVSHLNYASASLSLTGVLYGYALFKYRYLDLFPLARDVLFEQMHDAVLVLNDQDSIVDANRAAQKLFTDQLDLVGKSYDKIRATYFHDVASKMPEGDTPGTPVAIGKRMYDVTYNHVIDQRGRGSFALILFHDVTEREILHQQIAELGRRDPLTGVYNRRELLTQLVNLSHEAYEQQVPLPVLMLDLDGFKRVNDKYGHEAGDRTLELLAKILFRCIEPSDMVGRYGGDEFVIASLGSSQERAIQLGERIRKEVSQSTLSSAHGTYTIQVSIGVRCFHFSEQPDHDVASWILSEADAMLYAAKRAGKNRVYTEPLHSMIRPI